MTAKFGAVDRRHYLLRIGSVRKVGERVRASARLLDLDGAVLTDIVQERAHLPGGDTCREISHMDHGFELQSHMDHG